MLKAPEKMLLKWHIQDQWLAACLKHLRLFLWYVEVCKGRGNCLKFFVASRNYCLVKIKVLLFHIKCWYIYGYVNVWNTTVIHYLIKAFGCFRCIYFDPPWRWAFIVFISKMLMCFSVWTDCLGTFLLVPSLILCEITKL